MPVIDDGKVYIGVDPGASGGMACIAINPLDVVPMPETEREVWDWFNFFDERQSMFAVIEKVGGFIQGNPSPGSAMFKFGASYGGLRMALVASGIPFEEVTPQKWQKGLGIPHRKRDESKTSFKNRLKVKAQQLYPGVKVTLATADALLIATYCQRWREGRL